MDPASSGPDAGVWLLLALSALLTAFAAFADAALGGINRARVQRLLEDGMPRARAIAEALDHPNRYAITLLFLGTLGIIGYTVGTGWLLIDLPRLEPWLRGVIALGLLLVLGFCQVVARAFAVINAESSFGWVVRPIEVLGVLTTPFTAIVSGASQLVLKLTGADRRAPAPLVTEEDLRVLVTRGQEEGVIEAEERQMIQGVFELEDTSAREIMVPRIDVAAVPADATVAEVANLIVDRGFSRLPVYQSSIDEIVGIAYAKDVLKYLRDGLDHARVRELVRAPHFIPESKRINDLLHELQQSRVHMAIVVDEYGGTAGLVTIEDLLEEIVGEIQDEYDVEETKIERLSDREALFASTVSIEDVNDTLGLHLTGEDFDTIAGLVYDRLGKIPTAGDTVDLDEARVEVVAATGRRIRKVRVERLDRASPNGEAMSETPTEGAETRTASNGR